MNNILEHKGYIGSVEFNADDKVFFGKILGIKDLVTFEGESVSELEQSFHDMIEDYLQTCKKLKKEPEKTYKGSFNIRISSEMHKQAAIIASRKNISLNNFIKFALGWVITHENEIEPELKNYAEEGMLA
jgi:predicted HicB family RNase H-like nuclease